MGEGISIPLTPLRSTKGAIPRYVRNDRGRPPLHPITLIRLPIV